MEVPPREEIDGAADPPMPRRRGRRLAVAAALLTRLSRSMWFLEDELGGLREVIHPGDVCLDIGAGYGLYSLALADLTGPDGAVHCFEPQPGPFRVLGTALTLLGVRNACAYQGALGEQQQREWMSVPRRRGLPVHGRGFVAADVTGPGPNAVEFRTSRWLRVEATTLDEFSRRTSLGRVDFIKADVEGAELKVLRGGEQTLAAHRPTLQLEVEEAHIAKYGARTSELVGWLTARGYRMHVWAGGTWTETRRVTTDRRNYLFTP